MGITIQDNRVNLDNLIKGLVEIESKVVVVGVLETAGRDMQMIATANEFGTSKIPERSFLRSTADDESVKQKLEETASLYFYKALIGENTFGEVHTRMGQLFKRLVQARIASDIQPKNAESTLKRKKARSVKTLIDYGNLLKSIDFDIVNK